MWNSTPPPPKKNKFNKNIFLAQTLTIIYAEDENVDNKL